MEAAEWYKLRNDRTNRIDNILLDSNAKIISVIVRKYSTLNDQAMAICIANILSRWCRRIIFYIPEDIPCQFKKWDGMKLHEVILKLTNDSDPHGEFSIKAIDDFIETNIKISIGSTTNDKEFWIDSEGWIAGFGYGSSDREKVNEIEIVDNNVVGAIYASSIINSAVFSYYINGIEPVHFHKWITLVDFETSHQKDGLKNPAIPKAFDIGNIWQIGAGAVGSSFDFILSLFPVSGSIHIIDYDEVEIANTSSSLVFSAKNAQDEIKKVTACENALDSNHNLSVVPVSNKDYSNFLSEIDFDNNYPDLILCFANEKNVWSTIQYNDPPTVLHATTSSNWGVNFGRHIPFDEWCIVCRFGIKDYEFTPVCSSSTDVNNKEEEKLGILPFLSPMAAVLVFTELLKLSLGKSFDYPNNQNFIQLSLKNVENSSPQFLHRKPKANCPICADQNRYSYHFGYKMSKYYK